MDSAFGWGRYAGLEDKIVDLDRFGASGNGEEIVEHPGFTAKNVVRSYLQLI